MKTGFDVTPQLAPERAYLVGVSLPNSSIARESDYLDELEQLATTAGAKIVGRTVQGRTRIDGTTYVGSGKAKKIKQACEAAGANLLIFDNDLTPAQARNLERILDINVIDRTELILDIFARHAKTQQAKIQVELAQLQYALPRLTRLWDHLSRQQGGIGTRGPGETQLEVDRRRIYQRMGSLRRQLNKIATQKETMRKSHHGLPLVALVGYTNAGKSTLFRRLTGEDVYVRDQLFATLDTTTRRINGAGGKNGSTGEILLVDTVGFIRKLPHHLVTSFKATLADIASANLYLHVIDVSHPGFEEQMEVTDATVREIDSGDVRTILVFNKIDLQEQNVVDGLRTRYPGAVFVSAQEGTGVDELARQVVSFFRHRDLKVEVKIDAGEGKSIARIRALLHNVSDCYEGDVCVLEGTIDRAEMGRLESVRGARIRYLF